MSNDHDLSGPDSPHFQLPDPSLDTDSDAARESSGWEEVAEGRFMPKRVRGSCHGRALG
jgi:hypothetical protein